MAQQSAGGGSREGEEDEGPQGGTVPHSGTTASPPLLLLLPEPTHTYTQSCIGQDNLILTAAGGEVENPVRQYGHQPSFHLILKSEGC